MSSSGKNHILLLIGRILLGLIYASAVLALFKGRVPIEFASEGANYFRVPQLFVWLAFIIKAVAGVCILLGFKTRTAAYTLILFTLMTALNYQTLGGAVFMKEMSMIGGLLLLAAVGPGRWSLDGR